MCSIYEADVRCRGSRGEVYKGESGGGMCKGVRGDVGKGFIVA